MRAFTDNDNKACEPRRRSVDRKYDLPGRLPDLDAIDGLAAVYDSDDRFVAANARFYNEEEFAPEILIPGTPRADIVRAFLSRGRLRVEDSKEYDRLLPNS